MQFERIRKNHKRKIIIGGLILVCVISAITITTTRAKYKITQDIPLAKGTINYKLYDFKIMAMYKSEDKTNYTEINEMPTSGYLINEEKTYCTIDNKTQVKGKIKTVNGIHGLYNITKNDKCYLYFDKYVPPITIDNIITAASPKNTTPNFANAAESDEGVYKVSDGMYGGTSYYWRGAVTNNYVKFAGKCWRIVRINGDGSMRLIYDGTTCHTNGTKTTDSIAKTGAAYNISYDRSEYVGYTYTTGSQRTTSGSPSNLKTQNETWYSNNLASYASKIADGKYCNDRNIGTSYSWSSQTSSTFYYAGYDRSGAKNASSVSPTLSCPLGDVYTLKVGAITMDEVVMAGGKWRTANSSFYLYNGNFYWTMSPYNTSSVSQAGTFDVDPNGYLDWSRVSYNSGLRPVINLKPDTLFAAGGNGTQSNPYVVE